MKYTEEEIKELLEESDNDLKFKKYLNKVKNIFGEDYAALVLSCDYDIEKSINKFTSKFNRIDSIHIQLLLVEAALLSNNNTYKNLINEKMENNNYEELFPYISSNIYFRKGLTRLFVNQCDKTNYYIFNKKENIEEKEKIIDNIKELKRYERFLKVQNIIDKDYHIKRKRR